MPERSALEAELDAERMAEPHGADLASAKRRQQIVGPTHFEAFGEFDDVDLAEAQPPVLTLQQRSALGYMRFMILLFEPATDLGSRRGGLQISQVGIQPVAAGVAFPRRQDLDLLAAREGRRKRDDNTIDLGAAAAVTHLRCEPHRQSRAAWRQPGGR